VIAKLWAWSSAAPHPRIPSGGANISIELHLQELPFAHLRPRDGYKFLAQKKITMWYWGHEHRCVLYDPHPKYGLLARCIGHGGMPQRRGEERNAPAEEQKGEAIWRRLPERELGIPSALVLDGRNEFIKGKEDTYSPHGYVTLEFNGAHLHESVFLPDGTLVKEADHFKEQQWK
jgi:hypothetical protein